MDTSEKTAKSGLLGPFLVFLSAVFFALGGVLIEFIPWSPMAINAARCLLAGIFLLAVSLVTHHKFKITKSVILAGIGICVTNNLFVISTKLAGAPNAIVLQFTMPVYVILITWLVFRKKPKLLEIIITGTVLFGVVLFFFEDMEAKSLIGNICALVSGFFYALFFLFNNREDSEPVTSTLLAYAVSFLVGLPWLATTDFTQTQGEFPLWSVFAAVLALGFVQQGCAQLSFSIGIKRTTAVTAALVSGIEPILNSVLDILVFSKTLGLCSIIGGSIVLLSIIVYNAMTAKNK